MIFNRTPPASYKQFGMLTLAVAFSFQYLSHWHVLYQSFHLLLQEAIASHQSINKRGSLNMKQREL